MKASRKEPMVLKAQVLDQHGVLETPEFPVAIEAHGRDDSAVKNTSCSLQDLSLVPSSHMVAHNHPQWGLMLFSGMQIYT